MVIDVDKYYHSIKKQIIILSLKIRNRTKIACTNKKTKAYQLRFDKTINFDIRIHFQIRYKCDYSKFGLILCKRPTTF